MFVRRGVLTHKRRPAPGIPVNQIVSSLPQVFILIILKSRRINTYAPPPRFAVFCTHLSTRNPFGIRTYRKCARKFFRIRTCKNKGGYPAPSRNSLPVLRRRPNRLRARQRKQVSNAMIPLPFGDDCHWKEGVG